MITTPMIRPVFIEPERKELQDVTVLICQNKTPDLIRLCIESLLTFYPTIKILIVNGTADDEAGRWIKYKAARCKNITVWDREGYDSHGVAMNEAIKDHITTKYVLMLDSDTIIKRSGFIELIIAHMTINNGIFAMGALMEVTNSGDACGEPKDAGDILRYIHPSTGMINRDIYIEMLAKTKDKSAFSDHGAPCVYSMQYAKHYGYDVKGFAIADYVAHLSGASWTEPRTVWPHDNGVFVRPLVTFITDTYVNYQTDPDYDIIPFGISQRGIFVVPNGKPSTEVDNNVFRIRLKITGDYVCNCQQLLPSNIVERLRKEVTTWPDRLVIEIDGVKFYTREYFQNQIAWIS